MIVAAFDPGMTTGVCIFQVMEDDAHPLNFQEQVAYGDMLGYLDNLQYKPDVVVIEDFQLLPHKAKSQIGSKFETIEVIGWIGSWAFRHQAKVVKQLPTIKSIAQMWTQIVPPSNHAQSHWVDAYNHGMYYMINEGLAKSQLDREAAQK